MKTKVQWITTALTLSSVIVQSTARISQDSCLQRLSCLIGADIIRLNRFELKNVERGLSYLAHNASDPVLGNAYQRGVISKTCPETIYPCPVPDNAMAFELALTEQRSKRASKRSSRSYRPNPYYGGSSSSNDLFNYFFDHPIFTPKDAIYRKACQRCEAKRTTCFMYSLGTYGICWAMALVAGPFGKVTCRIATLPRSLDCLDNTISHCYLKDCGLTKGFLNFNRRKSRRRRGKFV